MACRLARRGKQKDRELFISYNDGRYVLFDFIEGQHFSPSLPGLASVARAIATMHRGFHVLGETEVAKIADLSKKSYTYFNKIPTYTANDFVSLKPFVDNSVSGYLDAFATCADEVAKNKEQISALPLQVVHSDLHPHNVLMRGDEVAALLDFDGLRVSQRARDVAFAIYRFGRQFFVRQMNVTPPEIRQTFLDAYEAVWPLSPDEKQLLPTLVKDEFLTKTLFVLRGVYLENNQTWAKDLSKFLPAIEEIEYLYE